MRSGVGNWVNAAMSADAARPMMNGALNAGLVPNPPSSHVVTSHIFPSFTFHSFFKECFLVIFFWFCLSRIFIQAVNFIWEPLIAID